MAGCSRCECISSLRVPLFPRWVAPFSASVADELNSFSFASAKEVATATASSVPLKRMQLPGWKTTTAPDNFSIQPELPFSSSYRTLVTVRVLSMLGQQRDLMYSLACCLFSLSPRTCTHCSVMLVEAGKLTTTSKYSWILPSLVLSISFFVWGTINSSLSMFVEYFDWNFTR